MIVPVADVIYQKGAAVFESTPEFDFVPISADEETLAAFICAHECRACVLGVDIYSGPLYEALPPGGAIIRFGVGTDGIDRKQLKNHDLLLANTPGTLDQSVAEHTIFLIGALVRQITIGNARVKSGEWASETGNELGDLTLGIVGLGSIGAAVARIAHQGFGMRVLVYQRSSPDATAKRLGFLSVESMLSELGICCWSDEPSMAISKADVVSVHLATNEDTIGYFNAERFAQLKPGAFFVNTSRGRLVVDTDLAAALESGQLAGAALDVFHDEPYQPNGVDLRKFDNVIMTPHVASNTMAANRKMAARVVENLKFWQAGKIEKMFLVE